MKKKQRFSFFLCLVLILSLSTAATPAAGAQSEPSYETITATPSDVILTLDGDEVALTAYNIGGNNYFRLRDLAYIFRDTEKSFGLTWKAETRTIDILSGKTYSPIGDETGLTQNYIPREAFPLLGTVLLDGHDSDFTAYTIENDIYFKLRDIAAALDVNVSWDDETRTISLNTAGAYIPLSSLPVPGTELLDTEAIAGKAASVVTLYTYDENGIELSQGAGFFIYENGWIVSCYHVFMEPFTNVVAVTDDGKTYAVQKVLAYDTARALIIVKANGIVTATPLALGSEESLRRGQQVVAISSPFDMRNTVSNGIVSAFRTDVELRSEGLPDIQITVPVSSGSSGGPLFDMYGNVKGIIYAKHLLAENANFAIPISDFYPLLDCMTPITFQEMQDQVAAAAAAAAAESAQADPSSLTQSAAAIFIP
jgi:hypothetical protein